MLHCFTSIIECMNQRFSDIFFISILVELAVEDVYDVQNSI